MARENQNVFKSLVDEDLRSLLSLDQVIGFQFQVEKKSKAVIKTFQNRSNLLGTVEKGILALRSGHRSCLASRGMTFYLPNKIDFEVQSVGSDVEGWLTCIPEAVQKAKYADIAVVETTELVPLLGKRICQLNAGTPLTSSELATVCLFLNEIDNARLTNVPDIFMPVSSQLHRVAELIVVNPGDTSSLDKWAKVAGKSRRSFTREFSEETGLSFVKWRRAIKLSAAVRRLSDGHSVSDVSQELGFLSTSAFIAVFKQYFGASPIKFIRAQDKKRI